MSYHHLPLICECGEIPERILEIGLSSEHELVVHYWCSECRRSVCVAKALTECWRQCPEPDLTPKLLAAVPAAPTAADAVFLQSMGISYLEENVDSR